jgi:hypothetical protein
MALNLVISWSNAKVCGQSWAETKAIGGFIRVVAWCAAIQSAIGFSSILILPLILLVHAAVPDYFPEKYAEGAVHLWYLTVVFPVLGTGLIITLQSWSVAARDRRISSMGIATYNTLAQIHNTYEAVSGVGESIGKVAELFKDAFSGDDDNPVATIALALTVLVVVVALCGGALITAALIQHYAGTVPLPERSQMAANVRMAGAR